jgi:type I restriction enzyme S subunit
MKMIEDVKVPEGWRRVRLGDLTRIDKGVTYKSSDYVEKDSGAIFINLKCIPKKGGFNKEGLKYYKGHINESQILRKGNIIIAIVDLARVGDIIGYPLRVPDFSFKQIITMSMDVVKIEPKMQIEESFLYYRLCLADVHSYILSISAGSTVLHLDLNWLPELVFSIPSNLHEQHKIAEILETVDNAIERTDTIIEKYKRVKQGLMRDLLTRGVVANDELGVMNYELRDGKKHRFKDYPPGRIPEEWEVVEIYEICNIINGGTPKTEKTEYWNGDIPWLSVEDLYLYSSLQTKLIDEQFFEFRVDIFCL